MAHADQTAIRRLRIEAGLTLPEVSRETGINKGRLSILERGVTPTEDEWRRIVDVLVQGLRRK